MAAQHKAPLTALVRMGLPILDRHPESALKLRSRQKALRECDRVAETRRRPQAAAKQAASNSLPFWRLAIGVAKVRTAEFESASVRAPEKVTGGFRTPRTTNRSWLRRRVFTCAEQTRTSRTETTDDHRLTNSAKPLQRVRCATRRTNRIDVRFNGGRTEMPITLNSKPLAQQVKAQRRAIENEELLFNNHSHS